jgi:hypothetical protein
MITIIIITDVSNTKLIDKPLNSENLKYKHNHPASISASVCGAASQHTKKEEIRLLKNMAARRPL